MMFASLRTHSILRLDLPNSTVSLKVNWSFILPRVLPLTFLTLVALIPLYFYIDDSRVAWLPLMALILFLPRPVLAIRTLFVSIQSIRQDMSQQRWELLILTGIPARRIVWQKWIQTVKQILPDQILFALPCMGLVVGISQFWVSTDLYCVNGQLLWIAGFPNQFVNLVFPPYCYGSYAYFITKIIPLNPGTTVSIIGLMVIVLFSSLEVCLNASIGLVAGFSRLASRGLGVLYGILLRVGLLFATLWIIFWVHDFYQYNLSCTNVMVLRENVCPGYAGGASYEFLRGFRRAYDTVELSIMPLADQGILLAANIMRPSDDRLSLIRITHYTYRAPRFTFIKNNYDNRPFVFRNLIAVAITGFFYWFLICFFLRRATRAAIVHHGASGYLEL